MRTLDALIDTQDPGWPLIQEWMAEAKNRYRILPKTSQRANQDLLDAQAAADEAAKTYQSVKQKLEENEQAKSALEQAKKNVTVADDVCSKAQTEYDALVQSWKKKQAAVAALNEKLQAVQSCYLVGINLDGRDKLAQSLHQLGI